MTHDDWRWMISVNIEGVTNGLTAFLPRMIAQAGEAHIVNTGSIAGLVALPERGVYAATTHAVVALSETLRIELAPHDSSEERRVGKECVSKCRSRCSPVYYKQKN